MTGPFQDTYQSQLNTTSLIPNLHGSDFMTQPNYTSQIKDTETQTHTVSMINLTGPTTDTYQTTLNIDSIAGGAHGSDFLTTPIEAFSSRFANQQGMLMDTLFESGFNRDDMYISGQDEPSIPLFKEFNRTETSLKRISLDSPNFDSDGNDFFTFQDRIPYNIPARDDSTTGFDEPFILRPIGNTWGMDKPTGDGFFSKVGGFLTEIDSAAGDITRGAPGFTGLISRTLHDAVRLGKWALTPKGIFFFAKQYGLQLLNPRPETRVYNPLSLGSIAPIVHIDRHLGGGNYMNSPSGPAGFTILDIYSQAIEIGPFAPQWAAAVATRTTLAHLAAMVPGAGGKVSFGALPELKFDILAGTIDSLSQNVVGSNLYKQVDFVGVDRRYVDRSGTPTLPSLTLNAGIQGRFLPIRYDGSPLTDAFTSGLEPEYIDFGVEKPGVFEGDFYSRDKPYADGSRIAEFMSSYNDQPESVIQIGKFLDLPVTDAAQKRSTYTIKFGGNGPVIPPTQIIDTGTAVKVNLDSIKGFAAERQFESDKYSSSEPYARFDELVSPFSIRKSAFSINEMDQPLFDYRKDVIHIGKLSKADETLGSSIDVKGKTLSRVQGDSPALGGFQNDIYNDGQGNRYSDKVKSYENLTTNNTDLNNTRLKIDSDGDPVAKIETAHLNSGRYNVDGQSTLESPIKLQNFPLFNSQDGGNLNSERQSLGFVSETGEVKLLDNKYGRSETTRFGFDSVNYLENIEAGADENRFPGMFFIGDDKKPKVEVDIRYQNNNSPIQNPKDTGVQDVEMLPDGVLSDTRAEKIESNAQGVGSKLDRYKTLAYGMLPQGDENGEQRYSKRAESHKRGEPNEGKPIPAVLPVNPTDTHTINELGGVGTVRIGGSAESPTFNTDKTDDVNLIKYGEGDENFYGDDHIKFKFYDIVNSKNIIFRATLSAINDTVTPDWSTERYIGRPDSVHVYQGVNRELSFDFIVAPFSKQEMLVCWEKLNYLMGLTYPTWKKVGGASRMEAPYIYLTIGDMFYQTPGYLSGLTFSVEDNVSWDIDKSTQLPQVLNVSVTFTHIGKHKLASQGKHYDLPWLKDLAVGDGNDTYKLGERAEPFSSLGTLLDV